MGSYQYMKQFTTKATGRPNIQKIILFQNKIVVKVYEDDATQQFTHIVYTQTHMTYIDNATHLACTQYTMLIHKHI